MPSITHVQCAGKQELNGGSEQVYYESFVFSIKKRNLIRTCPSFQYVGDTCTISIFNLQFSILSIWLAVVQTNPGNGQHIDHTAVDH